MRLRISIRGRVRPSVRPSVGRSVRRSVCPVLFSNDENRGFWGWKDFEWPTTTMTTTTITIIMINEFRQKGYIRCTLAVLVFFFFCLFRWSSLFFYPLLCHYISRLLHRVLQLQSPWKCFFLTKLTVVALVFEAFRSHRCCMSMSVVWIDNYQSILIVLLNFINYSTNCCNL